MSAEMPPDGSIRGMSDKISETILSRIDRQIKFYEDHLKDLKILRAKLENDPDLEHILASCRNQF